MSETLLEHGGRLRRAARRYAIPLERWLDLSTGINPRGYPVPPLPASAWARLPEEEDGLEEAARRYYGAPLLPVAGSQAAIQALPRLRPPGRVAVVDPGYAEHAHGWRRAGHEVVATAAGALEAACDRADVVVVINPNNPTGVRIAPERLEAWRQRLAARGGWLVVDEAFIDTTPGASLVPGGPREGLIVLRSLGKFFGLAGARVGFVMAPPALLDRLRAWLGPWPLAGPARFVATAALKDRPWQESNRRWLLEQGERLQVLLERHGLGEGGGTALFRTVETPRAAALHEALARRAVLTRPFEGAPRLRFGLPGEEPRWRHLEEALAAAVAEVGP